MINGPISNIPPSNDSAWHIPEDSEKSQDSDAVGIAAQRNLQQLNAEVQQEPGVSSSSDLDEIADLLNALAGGKEELEKSLQDFENSTKEFEELQRQLESAGKQSNQATPNDPGLAEQMDDLVEPSEQQDVNISEKDELAEPSKQQATNAKVSLFVQQNLGLNNASTPISQQEAANRSFALKFYLAVLKYSPKKFARFLSNFLVKDGRLHIKEIKPSLIPKLSPFLIRDLDASQINNLSDRDLSRMSQSQLFALDPRKSPEIDPKVMAGIVDHLDTQISKANFIDQILKRNNDDFLEEFFFESSLNAASPKELAEILDHLDKSSALKLMDLIENNAFERPADILQESPYVRALITFKDEYEDSNPSWLADVLNPSSGNAEKSASLDGKAFQMDVLDGDTQVEITHRPYDQFAKDAHRNGYIINGEIVKGPTASVYQDIVKKFFEITEGKNLDLDVRNDIANKLELMLVQSGIADIEREIVAKNMTNDNPFIIPNFISLFDVSVHDEEVEIHIISPRLVREGEGKTLGYLRGEIEVKIPIQDLSDDRFVDAEVTVKLSDLLTTKEEAFAPYNPKDFPNST